MPQSWHLTIALTRREIEQRYRGSFGGPAWDVVPVTAPCVEAIFPNTDDPMTDKVADTKAAAAETSAVGVVPKQISRWETHSGSIRTIEISTPKSG